MSAPAPRPGARRVRPWLVLPVGPTTAVQGAALVAAVLAERRAGRLGGRTGTRWMVAARLLAYFTEHASAHWLVGRLGGIAFTGYGLHGTSHPQLYPPGLRWVFSHLPLLSARTDVASLRAAPPAARAAMYAAGTLSTVVWGLAVPLHARRRAVPGAGRLLLVSGVATNAVRVLSEALRPGGDLRRAWSALSPPPRFPPPTAG